MQNFSGNVARVMEEFFFFSSRRRHTRCSRDWSSDVCSSDLTWGGTPAAPTGVATFSPGVTNTPSTVPTYFVATGPLGGGAGCTGTLTFKGYAEPGNTCAVNAPFTVTASGFPPIRRGVGQAGVAGSAPVLLYDAHG